MRYVRVITKLFDQVERASKAADLVNNADAVRKRSRVEDCVFRSKGTRHGT